MVKITSQDTNDSLVMTMMAVLPPFFTKGASTKLRQMFKGVAEVFKINVNQINDKYNNSFIMTSEGDELDDFITDISQIRRKNGESDIDYRNRYFKYIFEYNGTKAGIREAVYDITGDYPIQLLESNKRTAYWGEEDLALIDQIEGTAQYYTDTFENTPFWGDLNNINGFIGYIYLANVPTNEQLEELIDVLNYIKAYGVKIYLVYDDVVPIVLPIPTLLSEDEITLSSFRANFIYDTDMDYYIITLYDENDNIITGYESIILSSPQYEFTGLSDTLQYYYKLYSVKNGNTSPIATSGLITLETFPVFEHTFITNLEDTYNNNDWLALNENVTPNLIFEHQFDVNTNDNTANNNDWSEDTTDNTTTIFEHTFIVDEGDTTPNNNDWIEIP